MLWAEEGSEALVLVDRNLYSNKISGSMPTEIGKLARLEYMYNAAPATLCKAHPCIVLQTFSREFSPGQ